MTNVPHSGLTGTDLHESKGVAAAAANLVFVTDGAGSGVHKQVPAAALSSSANPFGAQLLHVREEQASNVGSANAGATGSYQTTVLNTVKTNEVTGASLSSNQIILPAGTYFVDGVLPYTSIQNGVATKCNVKLFNFTTSADIVVGQSSFGLGASGGGGGTTPLLIRGRFTLASTSTLLLQHYKINGAIGSPFGAGSIEVYTDILIWKIA